MKGLIIASSMLAFAAVSVTSYAEASSSGTVKLEVPVQTIITPIAADSLDFGEHSMSYFEEPRSLSTKEKVFTNVQTAGEDLCLTATFPKYNNSEHLPYLSAGSDSSGFNTPIYLSKVDYTTCGASPQTYSLIGSGSGTTSVTLPQGSGISESACLSSTGAPGSLEITTLPVEGSSTPLLGGEYTSTINLSVSEGHC